MKTMWAPNRVALFTSGQTSFPQSSTRSTFCSIARRSGLLVTLAQLLHHPANMVAVILHSEFALDNAGDALSGRGVCLVSPGQGSLEQNPLERAELLSGQPRRPARGELNSEDTITLLIPQIPPPHDRARGTP